MRSLCQIDVLFEMKVLLLCCLLVACAAADGPQMSSPQVREIFLRKAISDFRNRMVAGVTMNLNNPSSLLDVRIQAS